MDSKEDKGIFNGIMETKIKLYWILLLFIVGSLIVVVTWRGGDSSVLVNQISFATGIASIFLAVVAMFYSGIQASDASRQNEALRQTLSEIKYRTEELSKVKDELILFKQEVVAIRRDSLDGFARIEQAVTGVIQKETIEVEDDEQGRLVSLHDNLIEAIRQAYSSSAPPHPNNQNQWNVFYTEIKMDAIVLKEIDIISKIKRFPFPGKVHHVKERGYKFFGVDNSETIMDFHFQSDALDYIEKHSGIKEVAVGIRIAIIAHNTFEFVDVVKQIITQNIDKRCQVYRLEPYSGQKIK